jgi:serine/threonine protein kinase
MAHPRELAVPISELLIQDLPTVAQVTTAADIFSFGVLLWEVCTLEQPVNRLYRTIQEHEAPAAVRDLVNACMQLEPDMRPTAKQVLEVLLAN